MKKSIFTLLTIALLFCFVINTQTVFAIPQPFIRKFSIESLQGIRPSEYVSANAASLAKGKMLLRSKGRGQISIKRWQQSGQSYSNDLMQVQNVDIGTYGCMLTSFTMVADYLRNLDYDPGRVNKIITTAACPFQSVVAGQRCSLSVDVNEFKNVSVADTAAYVADGISQGLPVIIGMENSYTTHFVVAYAYSGELVYIKDPASDNKATLQDYTNNGYWVNRILRYSY